MGGAKLDDFVKSGMGVTIVSNTEALCVSDERVSTENNDSREEVHAGRGSKMASHGMEALGLLYISHLSSGRILIILRADSSYIIVKTL